MQNNLVRLGTALLLCLLVGSVDAGAVFAQTADLDHIDKRIPFPPPTTYGTYLPTVVVGKFAAVPLTRGCAVEPGMDSDGTGDALPICPGQAVEGDVGPADGDDVFAIQVGMGQYLEIWLTGTGGDADLFLYPPGAQDIRTETWVTNSNLLDNQEHIRYLVTEAGEWYINVYSFDGSTEYQLRVEVTDSLATPTD